MCCALQADRSVLVPHAGFTCQACTMWPLDKAVCKILVISRTTANLMIMQGCVWLGCCRGTTGPAVPLKTGLSVQQNSSVLRVQHKGDVLLGARRWCLRFGTRSHRLLMRFWGPVMHLKRLLSSNTLQRWQATSGLATRLLF